MIYYVGYIKCDLIGLCTGNRLYYASDVTIRGQLFICSGIGRSWTAQSAKSVI